MIDRERAGKPGLIAILREEIAGQGPMPFARFMELALYHPEFGYYTDPEQVKTGRGGDFYTSVSVGALFGQLLAQQFEQIWEILGKPTPFHVIEQGANDGRFASDVLQWMRQSRPDLFQATIYHLIEPCPSLQEQQKKTVEAAGLGGSVRWNNDVRPAEGVFFSNELVDSFPVHRVVYHGDTWHESHVVWEQAGFTWKNLSIDNPKLLAAVQDLALPKIQNYTTEINLAARHWISGLADRLTRGFVITIDYGYRQEVYYHPQRMEGTLLCYHRHQRSTNPLALVGEQDLTAHVDFSALMQVGKANGLQTLGFTDQHHFLIGLAHDDLATFEARGLHLDSQFNETARAFRTLMHPEILGSSFKFLVQGKGVENAPTLNGLKFAR